MKFDENVVAALGLERALELDRLIAAMLELVQSAPEETIAVTHLPVRLKGGNISAAVNELAGNLIHSEPGWGWATTTEIRPDGTRFGKASPFISPPMPGSVDWFIHFLFSDVHTRLGAYWLNHLWRGAELATASGDALGRWQVLVAAACSRSLLEGAIVFAEEVQGLLNIWDDFKRKGKPKQEELEAFVKLFNENLLQVQYASRITRQDAKYPLAKSKNILTHIEKWCRREKNDRVGEIYEWLCDAVHPSWGFKTVYITYRGMHESRTHLLEKYARFPLSSMVGNEFGATVAKAAADSVIIACEILMNNLKWSRWIFDDIGFTSGVSSHAKLNYFGRMQLPGPNDRCPCDSGRKFKKCFHMWGESGLPPSVN